MKNRWIGLILCMTFLWNFAFAGTVYAEENGADMEEKTEYNAVDSQTNGKCRIAITYLSINKRTDIVDKYDTYDTSQEIVVEYVEPGTTYGEVLERAKGRQAPKACEGLVFQRWEYEGEKKESDVISTDDSISIVAEYDKVVAICRYDYLNEEGGANCEALCKIVDKSMAYSQLWNEFSNYSVKGSVYEGLSITSWIYTGREGEETSAVTVGEMANRGICKLSATASYDKGIIGISYIMKDQDGNAKVVTKKILADKNITNGEALELCRAAEPAAEYTAMPREGWRNYLSVLEGNQDGKFFSSNISSQRWLQTEEVYTGQTLMNHRYGTLGENGDEDPIGRGGFKWYPSNTTYEAVIQDGKNTSLKVDFAGLDFNGWELSYCPGDMQDTIEFSVGASWINYSPVLNNTLVRYYIKYDSAIWGEGQELVKTSVLDRGAEIPLPSSIGEYQNIVWDTDSIPATAEEGIINIVGTANVYDPANATEEDELLKKINESQDGESVEASMQTAVLSKKVLEALGGKDVELRLAMQDGMEWKINGKEMSDTKLPDSIDFSVTKTEKTEGNIPEETMNEIAGSRAANQLILAHEGEFPFEAVLGIGVDSSLNGKKGVLLWHDHGEMKQVDADLVENSRINLQFRHASDYALIYAANGDVNNDNKISMLDLMRMLYHISGRNPMDALQQGIADVNYDDKVSMTDLMMTLYYVSGRRTEL